MFMERVECVVREQTGYVPVHVGEHVEEEQEVGLVRPVQPEQGIHWVHDLQQVLPCEQGEELLCSVSHCSPQC